MSFIDYSRIPTATMASMQAWVQSARPTGDFVSAVVRNELHEAVMRADESNSLALRDICAWFYNVAPAGCWGSRETARAWAHKMANASTRNPQVHPSMRDAVNSICQEAEA